MPAKPEAALMRAATDPHGGAEARIHSGRHHAAATAPGVLVAGV